MYCKRAFQPFPTTGRDEGLNDILHVHLDNFKINHTPNTHKSRIKRLRKYGTKFAVSL